MAAQEGLIVIVGKGIFHAVEVAEIPKPGDLLNLQSAMLNSGKFRVTSVDSITWDDREYPHVLVERVGDILTHEKPLPIALLNV